MWYTGRITLHLKKTRMPTNTKAVVDARRAEIEQCLLEGEWSLVVQRQIADKHGVTTRQVKLDAAHIRREWADQADEDSAKMHRARILIESAKLRRECRDKGHTMTAARLLHLEAQITGASMPQRVEVTHTHQMENDPIIQAQAIVEHYEEAKRFLDSVEPKRIILLGDTIDE